MENFGRQQSTDIRIEKGCLSRASCAVQPAGIGEDNWWKTQNRCLHHRGLAAKSRVVSRSALRRPRQQTQEKADRKNARTLSLHPCSRPHRGALLRRLFSRKRPRLTCVDSQSPPPAAKSPRRGNRHARCRRGINALQSRFNMRRSTKGRESLLGEWPHDRGTNRGQSGPKILLPEGFMLPRSCDTRFNYEAEMFHLRMRRWSVER